MGLHFFRPWQPVCNQAQQPLSDRSLALSFLRPYPDGISPFQYEQKKANQKKDGDKESPCLRGMREAVRQNQGRQRRAQNSVGQERRINQKFETYIVDLPDDYWTYPPRHVLEMYTRAELARVPHFRVANIHGQVEFLQPVNLNTCPSLAAIIQIANSSICIYKEGENPAPGEGLNVPFRLTFYQFAATGPRLSFSQEMVLRRACVEWTKKHDLKIVKGFDLVDRKLVVEGNVLFENR